MAILSVDCFASVDVAILFFRRISINCFRWASRFSAAAMALADFFAAPQALDTIGRLGNLLPCDDFGFA